MRGWKTWLVVGVAVALALVGALAVAADDPSTSTGIWSGRGGGKVGMPNSGTHWQPNSSSFMEAWAAELGTTVDALKAAAKTAWGKLIDQAVTDGNLTEDQAAQMRERPVPFVDEREPFDRGLMDQVITPQEQQAFWADQLGLTSAELQAKLDAGEKMQDLIRAAQLARATLQAATETFRKAEIGKAVEEGILTQEQADKLTAMPTRSMGGGHRPGGPEGGDWGPSMR